MQKVETEEIVDTNFVSFHLHTTGKSNIQELLLVISSKDYD